MIQSLNLNYRNAFIAALSLHILIAIMLCWESSSNKPPVLTATKKSEPSISQTMAMEPQQQAIKAVSVDSQEVMQTVNRLKEERAHQKQMEENRQRSLAQQAELARKQRIVEQQRIEKLKNEANKLAIAHKKQMEEEQQHLKQLARQKVEEEKHLEEMKAQRLQMQKQAELQKKKADELAHRLETEKQTKLAKANDELQKKRQDDLAKKQQATAAAASQAALDAEKNAQMTGEVDKYKALIIGAISRQWILPENADSKLSSQFRIRLAPNGAVLEVSLTRSSGDPILDRSAQSAIYKASPLPVPNDPNVFNLFRDISLTVRPENARG